MRSGWIAYCGPWDFYSYPLEEYWAVVCAVVQSDSPLYTLPLLCCLLAAHERVSIFPGITSSGILTCNTPCIRPHPASYHLSFRISIICYSVTTRRSFFSFSFPSFFPFLSLGLILPSILSYNNRQQYIRVAL